MNPLALSSNLPQESTVKVEELAIPQTNEQFIETQLEKFDVKKEELIAMADRLKDLKVDDIDNRVQLAAVRSARIELKDKRVDITKKGKSLRASAIAFTKAVIGREQDLINLIEPTENLLAGEEDRVLAARAEADKKKEKEAADRINNMQQQLAAVNYAVDYHDLLAMDDQNFADVLKSATELYEEHLRVKEQERLAKEEEERQAAIKLHEEKERLRIQAEEQAKQQAEFIRQQEAFRAEQEKVAEEQRKREKAIADEAARIAADEKAKNDALNAEYEKIKADREKFEKEQKEASERTTILRFQALKELGMFQNSMSGIIFYEDILMPMGEIEELPESNWIDLFNATKVKMKKLKDIEAKERKKKEAEEKIEEENRLAAIEADRVASLTDMEKLREFAGKIDDLASTVPLVTSKMAAAVRHSVFTILEQASKKCKTEIQ